MQERLPDFSRYGTEILLVSFGPIQQIEGFRQRLGLPFPVAADPERRAYQAYGVEKASFLQVWSPRVVWKYLTLVLRGKKPQTKNQEEDVYQLGGDFLVDAQGRILFAHVSKGPVDRPAVFDILNALEEVD